MGCAQSKAAAEGGLVTVKVTDGYAAFVSHYKEEAAMEARFLQMELEKHTGSRVFLDSDDLRSLQKLSDPVRQSKVLILVQTKSVLTRPFCLLEMLAAIDAGIPIVGVGVEGRTRDAYNFADAQSFLTHSSTSLRSSIPERATY